MVSFSWGTGRLEAARHLHTESGDPILSVLREDQYWSFGQVAPIVLLITPLFSIFKYFYPGT